MKTKIISLFLSLLFLSTAMGQQLAPLAEQTSIPRIVDAFLKRGNKVLEQDARFARELVWFDAVVRQKWGQWDESYKKIYNECVERNYFASRNAWIQLDHYFGSEAHWSNPTQAAWKTYWRCHSGPLVIWRRKQMGHSYSVAKVAWPSQF